MIISRRFYEELRADRDEWRALANRALDQNQELLTILDNRLFRLLDLVDPEEPDHVDALFDLTDSIEQICTPTEERP